MTSQLAGEESRVEELQRQRKRAEQENAGVK
jgi:hypothetical protein